MFFAITFLVFLLSTMMEGSPATLMITPTMTPEDVAALEHSMGLDQPIISRYFTWLTNFLKGNLGTSYSYSKSVSSIILQRLVPTLTLTVSATLLAILIAIPAGTFAACHPYTPIDYLCSGASFLGAASPDFFVALVAIYFFALKWNVLPSAGMAGGGSGTIIQLRYAVMPVAVLTFTMLGSLMRQTRSAVMETLTEDFIRTDRALGYGEAAIMCHALRNAMIPIVTIIGSMVPRLISGSVLIETVFSWPGLGKLMVSSITSRDYPMIVAITTLIAIVVLACNILIDFIYTVLDPRIRHTKKQK